MSASPTQVNGTPQPSAMPVMGDWQPIMPIRNGAVWERQPAAEPTPTVAAPPAATVAPIPDPIAEAEAEAIRARAWAEAEAARKKADADADERRIRAEAEAKAIEIKAVEEAKAKQLATERGAMRLEKEREDHAVRLAETRKRREQAEREAEAARAQAEQQQQTEAAKLKEADQVDEKWRRYAIRFAIVCGIVALPVQVAAFWNPQAPWLVVAPVMLEGGAWVVLRGAAAAVVHRRPVWHYRAIAWALAFIAAGVNLWHGLNAFDPATAVGTAFASLAGPGVWDLHEHGRIRTRDGKLSRGERRKQRAEAKRAAAAKAATERRAAEEKKAADVAARAAAEKLAEDRAETYPEEWKRALEIAAAVGEISPSETTWRRAWKDINGTDIPGEKVDVVTGRTAAVRRMANALGTTPANTPSKVTSAQRAIQIKSPSRRSAYKPVPPRRAKGDTPQYHPVAGREHGETQRRASAAKSASTTTQH